MSQAAGQSLTLGSTSSTLYLAGCAARRLRNTPFPSQPRESSPILTVTVLFLSLIWESPSFSVISLSGIRLPRS